MTRIVGTVKSNIREDIKDRLFPLLFLGERLARRIQARVHTEGVAADGAPWSSYKGKRKPPVRGDRFYWTKPGEPAPDMHRVIQATKGKFAGRSAYPSYAHWREAMGVSDSRKRFKLTAELEGSIGAIAKRANLVTVAYNGKARRATYGRAKSGKAYSNQKVAQFAFRTERMSPMQLSEAEVKFAADFAMQHLPASLLKDLSLANTEASAIAGASRVTRRVNRLLVGAGVRI